MIRAIAIARNPSTTLRKAAGTGKKRDFRADMPFSDRRETGSDEMLDITVIREAPDLIRRAAEAKGFELDLDRLLALDDRRRDMLVEIETRRAERNRLSKEIPKLSPDERANAVGRAKLLNTELSGLEAEFGEVEGEFRHLMYLVPNPPAPDIPFGRSDADNVEIRRHGSPTVFDFEPKDHMELGLSLGLFDVDRARKFAGSRSYILTGDGALLNQAVLQFALQHVVSKGFKAISPPIMVREQAMLGTGFFPTGREDTYSLGADELFLTGTSEVSLVAMHMDEVLDLAGLPVRYAGISPCFRREAGAAGRDTRGLYRVHMFHKVEQVIIGPNDEEASAREHALLLENSEEILQALGLPYRVALACTAELGLGQVRKHEVETWMPSRNTYSETHSCSTLHEFQSRRSNIRYREEGTGALRFTHTLNNTAIASPRILIPLLENFQTKDGAVVIPEALRPFMMGKEILEPAG